jgi:hypothetical protein
VGGHSDKAEFSGAGAVWDSSVALSMRKGLLDNGRAMLQQVELDVIVGGSSIF